jgi:radical SAM protein with 4Fe4S-binding SPASM domain
LNDFKKIKKTYDFDIKKIKSLYILPDWWVYPAWNLINYKIWNINENSLLKILNNKRLESLYNPDNLNGSFCNKCKYKYNCSWDRWVALFYTDNIFWDDIQCPFYKNK